MTAHEKLDLLKQNLSRLNSLAVAFSGGVDSTFLLKVAQQVLGENVLAVTARSATYPEREYNEAASFAAANGSPHLAIVSEELDIDGFCDNPTSRCYLCKQELFTKIKDVAREKGIAYVAEGSNCDDLGDYRPGLAAVRELGILSPLRDAGLSKAEIRTLSRELNLPTANKQSFACLSSRFVYGEKITREKLAMVDKAEQLLLDLGFSQVRVRMHGNVARIEIDDRQINDFLDCDLRNKVYDTLKKIGFVYVALDLRGYRSGSMNDVLTGIIEK